MCVSVCVCVCACAKSLQSCPTLCDPVDCSPPGSSIHGILRARILEWVAILSSRGIFLGVNFIETKSRREAILGEASPGKMEMSRWGLRVAWRNIKVIWGPGERRWDPTGRGMLWKQVFMTWRNLVLKQPCAHFSAADSLLRITGHLSANCYWLIPSWDLGKRWGI